MATNLMNSWEKTKRVRLPEETVKIDPKSVVGAATLGTIIRANKTGDYENVSNALTLHNAVQVMDESDTGQQVVGKMETYILNDGTQDHEVTDVSAMKVFLENGMTLIKTVTKDIIG